MIKIGNYIIKKVGRRFEVRNNYSWKAPRFSWESSTKIMFSSKEYDFNKARLEATFSRKELNSLLDLMNTHGVTMGGYEVTRIKYESVKLGCTRVTREQLESLI